MPTAFRLGSPSFMLDRSPLAHQHPNIPRQFPPATNSHTPHSSRQRQTPRNFWASPHSGGGPNSLTSPAVCRLQSFQQPRSPENDCAAHIRLTEDDRMQIEIDGVSRLTIGETGISTSSSCLDMMAIDAFSSSSPYARAVSASSSGVMMPSSSPRNVVRNTRIRWSEILMGKSLGVGGLGCVFLAKHTPTNTPFAAKVLRFDRIANPGVFEQEIRHLVSSFRHPNIVTSYEAFYQKRELMILMELMDMGSLSRLQRKCGPMPEFVVASLAWQTLQGLNALHQCGYVHRDIKPSNLLLSSRGEVKISDFGLVTCVTEFIPTMGEVNSHCYLSPELLVSPQTPCSYHQDIWSFGLVVTEAALGVFPFVAEEGEPVGCARNSGGSALSRRASGYQLPFIPEDVCPTPVSNRNSNNGMLFTPPAPRSSYPVESSPRYFLQVPASTTMRDIVGTASCPNTDRTPCSVRSFNGNPFEYCMGVLDFQLLMQDPSMTIRFDTLCPRIAIYYPHWPHLDPSPFLREFVGLCTRYHPAQRPSCAELLCHPFAYEGQSVGATGVQEWLERMRIPPVA